MIITERFDQWASSYDASALQPAYRAAHAAVLTRVLRHVTQPVRVLDVGCGTGRLVELASRLLPPGSLLVGVDTSIGMLQAAGGRLVDHRRCVRVQAAVEHLPFADVVFDVVMSTWSFRHWQDPQAGIAEIRRVLAPTGIVALAGLLAGSPERTRIRPDRHRLPAVLSMALAAADLYVSAVGVVDGFGPIPEIKVVVARPRPVHRRPGRTASAIRR